MEKPINLDFERFKKYFMENVAPVLEEEARKEQEFMDRIQREGIPWIKSPPLRLVKK